MCVYIPLICIYTKYMFGPVMSWFRFSILAPGKIVLHRQHPHLAVWQVSLEVIEARHVLQWTLLEGDVCVVGWHPLVECTQIRSVCFIVLLLVYSWVIPGESIYLCWHVCLLIFDEVYRWMQFKNTFIITRYPHWFTGNNTYEMEHDKCPREDQDRGSPVLINV